jgi:DNA-binding NarL/FixJ family response regulator
MRVHEYVRPVMVARGARTLLAPRESCQGVGPRVRGLVVSAWQGAQGLGSGKKRVLVIDDHPIVREGIAQLLALEDDLGCCGSAVDALTARRAVLDHLPDVAVLDLSLGRDSGLELIPQLLDDAPGLAVLVLSMHDESLYAKRALQAGARGYIMKHEGTDLLLQAIRTVVDGQIYVSPQVNATLLRTIAAGGNPRASQPIVASGPLAELSNRELDVYRLVGRGLSTKEIASQLHLSAKTVETHRAHIKQKLGLEGTAALVAHAAQWLFRGTHAPTVDTIAEVADEE